MEFLSKDQINTQLRQLSPLRNSSKQTRAKELAEEQARHFGVDPESEFGKSITRLAIHLYGSNLAVHELCAVTMKQLNEIDRSDRIAWFNAKRFISFQLAKILDTLQNPTRAVYQSITTHHGGFSAKGAYPLFDNITAIFSASPVITRTATYLFACTEWVEDAFAGREPLHEIYSRLLNPTSITLANHIVDVECGEKANEYMAWNFNSGMAAIDAILSHLIGYEDIIISSRNIYGGTYQLLHDWYAKSSNLNVALEWVDAYDGKGFANKLSEMTTKHQDRLASGRKIYVYLESPCNPHGYVLDVPGIAEVAHKNGWRLIVDSTVGTPFLHPLLKHPEPIKRPDFVVHSYTKDLTGTGTTTAGVVIGKNADMFIPKNSEVEAQTPSGEKYVAKWNETLFWNVYYVKGGFLDSEKAFEVLTGMKTFEMRVLQKAINTTTLALIFDAHPDINVSCPVLETNPNHEIFKNNMWLGLPSALFTINMEGKNSRPAVKRDVFKKFLDILEPSVGMQVSLGQTNTVALCPAMTTHSELSDEALQQAGISPTTLRISVGLEDPRMFIVHLQNAAKIAIDSQHGEFSTQFISAEEIDAIYKRISLTIQEKYLNALPNYNQLCS